MLIENEKVVLDKRGLVKIFTDFFSNIVSNLDIQRPPNITHDSMLNEKKKMKITQVYQKQKKVPSDVAFPFSFKKVALNEIINEIKNSKKALNLMTFQPKL